METKNLLIICVAVILCLAIVMGIFLLNPSQEESVISADIPSSLTVGDSISVSLIDENGNPLSNKDIILTFTNSNNKSKNITIQTNDKGIAKYQVKLDSGKYTINGLFKDDKYKSSNFIKEINIKNKKVTSKTNKSSATQSSNSKYSSKNEDIYGTDECYESHGFIKQNGQWCDQNGNPAA